MVVRIAVRAIEKNRLRSWLTVIGVVIGIAALTTTVSIGASATLLVRDQFEQSGSNLMMVRPEPQFRRGQEALLTAADAEAIARECPAIEAASPFVLITEQVVYGNSNRRPSLIGGVGLDYLSIRNRPLAAGSFFTERDVQTAAKVCVIGHTVREKLFQSENPLYKTLRVGDIPLRVIGVLEQKGANLLGQDRDDVLITPYTTARKRLQGSGFNKVDFIVLSARSPAEVDAARRQLMRLLHERHRVRASDADQFRVADVKEYEDILEVSMKSLTLTLGTIAGISLLVGGIGIMNIMLVSVTERTREIGLRMAVGANSGDILRQFLVEAVVLSTMGGVIGILIGSIASVSLIHVLNTVMPNADLPTTVSFSAATVALLFAVGVGVFFGYYPARQASKLDPIEALRYE